MLEQALIFDSPYGMIGTMRCGNPRCNFYQEICYSTEMPPHLACPECGLLWRFSTSPNDPHHPSDMAATIFCHRLPELGYFTVDAKGDIKTYSHGGILI